MFSCEYDVTLKAAVLKSICERLLLKGKHRYSTNEILKFYYWEKIEVSPFSFRWFFFRVLSWTIYYFSKKFIYLRKKYYTYCWSMKQFLNVIKVSLVHNLSYSCFPPGWYKKNVVFDLIFKWDVKTYQMEVMTK